MAFPAISDQLGKIRKVKREHLIPYHFSSVCLPSFVMCFVSLHFYYKISWLNDLKSIPFGYLLLLNITLCSACHKYHSSYLRWLFLHIPDRGWSAPLPCYVCWAWPGRLAWCTSTRARWSWPTCSPSSTPCRGCSSSSSTVCCRRRWGFARSYFSPRACKTLRS